MMLVLELTIVVNELIGVRFYVSRRLIQRVNRRRLEVSAVALGWMITAGLVSLSYGAVSGVRC